MKVNKVSGASLSPYDKSVIVNALHAAIAHEADPQDAEKYRHVLEKVSGEKVALKWSKVSAGHYVSGVYETRKHDGLTWQDRPYWVLYVNAKPVTWNNGQARARRFHTLAEVKAFAQDGAK